MAYHTPRNVSKMTPTERKGFKMKAKMMNVYGVFAAAFAAAAMMMTTLVANSTCIYFSYQDELPEPKHMFLRVLAAQMGVGGDDSWMSPVHEQYQLPADQPLSLNVQLKLF